MRSNLLRPLPLLMVPALLVVGCQAAIIRAPGVVEDGEPTPISDPESFFLAEVEPILALNCAGCHEDETASRGAVFLNPASYYASVRNYEGLVVPGDTAASRLLTKGEHRGPELSANDATTIGRWIDAEGAVMMPPPVEPPVDATVTTSAYPVDEGENRIPLTEVGLPGAELVFTAMRINSGANMLLTNMELVAGAGGLSITHPRLIIIDDEDASATRLDADTFADVTLRVEAGMTGTLTSTHAVAPFPAMGSIAVRFDSAEVPATM